MNKRIVYKKPCGGCGIITPLPGGRQQVLVRDAVFTKQGVLKKPAVYRAQTDSEFLRWVAEKDVPSFRHFMLINMQTGEVLESEDEAKARMKVSDLDAKPKWRITDAKNIPTDRTFRDAWTDDHPTQTVDVRMDRARDIHMNRIREKRQERFVALGFPHRLDPDLEKNLIPEEKSAELKRLRDLPQTVDLSKAETPDDLKYIWPEELS